MPERVLLVGHGGRENALAWKLKQSPHVKEVYFAPDNLTPLEVERYANERKIFLTVVGPDDFLAQGIVNLFLKGKRNIFGPTKEAAEIEWSKAFAKQLMEEKIPTSSYSDFSDYKAARKYISSQQFPLYIKASGLALGKGAIKCTTGEEAEKALNDIMIKKVFGEAGETVVIEECLIGEEVSFHAFSDGKTFQVFPTAQDHKTIFDDNQGPNTGGMGTISPVPSVTKEQVQTVKKTIIVPILQALQNSGRTFTGCLYPGLMMTSVGPKVIEFNARFGDPEAQSYMRLLKSDLFEILVACVEGNLSDVNIEWEEKYACCIVMVSEGYPGPYVKGDKITGIEEAEKDPYVEVFLAGAKQIEHTFLTAGGRVLGVTATGNSLDEALDKGYEAVEKIYFRGMRYRRDIGAKYR